MLKRWSYVNAIYQIYPRSFQDSDGDGVGDLLGIIDRLDYLKGGKNSLGVDAIWLSPFYASPMRDFGYDVSDYRAIDPLFGSMSDFDRLVKEAHRRDIKVMVDFVPNHTSSEHKWFKEALNDPGGAKRKYYIFRDPSPDGGPPNNWLSVFGGSAWQFDEASGQYYLHSFLKEQPDLDWRNPQVQHEMQQVLRFWLDRGVDGFRADAVRWMGKNPELPDDPINDSFRDGDDPYWAITPHHSRYSPELTDYLRAMTGVVREYDDRIILFEDHIDDLSPIDSQVRRLYSVDTEVAAPFNFQGIHLPFEAQAFADMIQKYQISVPNEARAFYCLSNHDEPRLASRVGDEQARLLGAMQLLLPGTPVIYYGQELGMNDTPLDNSQRQDPFEYASRDAQRTPMQWDNSPQAGFSSSSTPWLPLPDNYNKVNVVEQLKEPDSSLQLYRTLLELRRQYPVFHNGSYRHVYADDSVFVFAREDDRRCFVVIANFSDKVVDLRRPIAGEVVVSTHDKAKGTRLAREAVSLQPFELIALEIVRL